MFVLFGGNAFAQVTKTLEFEVSSTSAVTLKSGTLPEGVTVSYSSTYGNKFQLTKGNSMTLTLTNFPCKVSSVTLDLKTNTSSGQGNLTVKHNNVQIHRTDALTPDIVAYSTTYQEYTFDATDEQTSGDLVITLAATINSIYCDAFTITYVDESSATGTEDPQNSFTNATEYAKVGEPYTVQEITTLSTGRKSYESSEESVATIDGSGNVTLKKQGETTITVRTAADAYYMEGFASYTLIVSKGTPVLSFASENVTAYIGTDQPGPTLTNPGDGAVTYEISDPEVATIQSTGYIHPLKVGTATVTATAAETDAWESATATYTLVVEETFSIDAEGTYEWVKDASTLAAGDELVFVHQSSDVVAAVMGNKQQNNFGYVGVNYAEDITDKSIITIPEDKAGNATPILLEGSEGAWYFRTNKGYLYAAGSGSNNHLKITTTINDNAKAVVTVDDNGNAGVVFQGSNTNKYLRYNSQSSLFSCYGSSSSQTPVQIYRKVETQSSILSYSPTSYTITIGDDFTAPEVNKPNDYDGTITYSSDNTDVAEVDAETGAVTVKGAGTATITATGTATEHFNAATASYTLTVKKKESSVSFAESVVEITYGDNYNKQAATTEGFSGNLVYTSNDEKVVKFHGNNVIDVLGPGTVTITATAPATDTTEESSATYTLKVYEPSDATEGTTELLNEPFNDCAGSEPKDGFGGNSNGFTNVPSSLTDAGWEFVSCQAGNGYLKVSSSKNTGMVVTPAINLNGASEFSFEIAPWISETATVTVSLENATFEDGETTSLSFDDLEQSTWKTKTFSIIGNGDVKITITASRRVFIDNFVVGGGAQPAHEINLTFGSTGYLTWVATADIDFSQTSGVTAYQITEATSQGITAEEVDKVPAGAAVMLKGSGRVQLKRTSDVAALANNKMLACTDASVVGITGNQTTTSIYVLGNGSNGLGYYMLKNTLQAGKGYLDISGAAGAKPSFIAFEETEPTGISSVRADSADGVYYNLQGVRVLNPQKGIYIKDGKKIVVK